MGLKIWNQLSTAGAAVAAAGVAVVTLELVRNYGANAVACQRGLTGRTLPGQPLAPVIVLGATALALAAVALVWLRA
jgi:hypothetical protein